MKPSPERPEEASIRLHSSKQVAGAAALGGPIAGVWLLAHNRKRLALGSGIRYVALVTIGTMLLFHLVVSIFPTDFPVEVGPVLSGALFWGLFKYSRLSDKYDEFITTGGKKASIWRAAMITIVSIPLSLAGLFLLETVLPIKPINHVAYPPSSVYFEGEATKADAQALGDLFQNEGFLHDEVVHHLTVQRESAPHGDTSQVVIIRWRLRPPEPGTPMWQDFDNLRAGIQRLLYPDDEVRLIFENALGITSAQIPARE